MGIYYRTDSTRMSIGELWGIASSFRVFWHLFVRKVLRIRAPVRWAIRHDDTITVLPAEKVSPHARRILEPLIEEFQRLGARFLFYKTITATKNLKGYVAVLLPAEQNAIIDIVWSRAEISKHVTEGPPACAIYSHLQDGTFLSTSYRANGSKRLPPGFKLQRCRGATFAELILGHKEALAKCDLQPVTVRNEEDAKKIQIEIKRRNFEWNVSRGVYVVLTPAEKAKLGIHDEEGRDR